MEYSFSELKILWYLKRHGPMLAKGEGTRDSLMAVLETALDLRRKQVAYNLRNLEARCIVLRIYKRDERQTFKGNQGYNPVLRIELVDPKMELPPLPHFKPQTIIAYENRQLEEIVIARSDEPTAEAIVEALLNRITELQGQVGKLQDIVEQQANAMMQRKERSVEHLRGRIQDALTAEQWDALRKKRTD